MRRAFPLVVSRAVLLVVLAGIAAPVVAQGGGGGRQPAQEGDRQRGRGGGGGFGGGMFGGRSPMDAAVSKRDVDSINKILALSADQKQAVDALFEGYQQSADELTQSVRDRMQAMREGDEPGPDMWRKMGEEMDKARRTRKELDASFFSDVKAVLTTEQTEKWPAFERSHRRESTISRGMLSGERVDLVKLVDDLKLSEDARKPLDPVLDQYTAELDRELIARNEVYDKMQGKMREIFQSGDMDAMQKMFDDGRAVSTKVREVNRRFARQIEGLLPDDSKPAFSTEVRKESFPLIYRPSQSGRALESAAKIADLDEAQKTTIATITEGFNRDLAALNKDMEEAWTKREATITPQDMFGGRMGGGGGGPGGGGMLRTFLGEDASDLVDRRRSIEDAVMDKLKATLNPEQFESLPKRQDGAGRGGQGGNGEDGNLPPRRRAPNGGGDRPAQEAPRRDSNRSPSPSR